EYRTSNDYNLRAGTYRFRVDRAAPDRTYEATIVDGPAGRLEKGMPEGGHVLAMSTRPAKPLRTDARWRVQVLVGGGVCLDTGMAGVDPATPVVRKSAEVLRSAPAASGASGASGAVTAFSQGAALAVRVTTDARFAPAGTTLLVDVLV